VDWLTEANVCPGLFYGTPAQDGFLMRLRIPGGWLYPQQARKIAALAEQWGSETIQVTNRANLQIRSVHTIPSLEVFQALQDLGVAAQNPNVDHLRNLMASPTAGIDPQELLDTRPWVQALDAYIQSHPELVDLSAKFSIGIDGGGTVGIGTRSAIAWEHRYNEIQLSAVLVEPLDRGIVKPVVPRSSCQVSTPDLQPQTPYFRLALGGDKRLWETQQLIAPEDCIPVIAALTQVYLDYVKAADPSTKKPRMKHLLQDWGLVSYLNQVNARLQQPLMRVMDSRESNATLPYGHLGVHPQRQANLSYVGVGLRLGQLTIAQLRELAQLIETMNQGYLCLTPWQTLLLPNIANDRISEYLQHLSSLGLSVSANQVDAAIVACAGKPGCAAAMTQTQPHALALADTLRQQVTLDRPINIHVTGCPKSCAQPSPAEITLLGTTIEHQGEIVEAYHIYLGTPLKSSPPQFSSIPFANVPTLIEKLLRQHQKDCIHPEESVNTVITSAPINHT
jgi:ferredoxin-nitrite reductase